MSEYPWFDFDRVDYVTADTHFSHARISELADRPFTTVNEMNTELIRRWNETVAPTDVVLHLGDVALGPIEESITLTAQLNGHRYLVPGNHDRVSPATQSRKAIERFAPLYEAAGWTILPEVIEGTRHGYRILASHYPYKGDSQESWAAPFIRSGRCASRRFPVDGCIAERSRPVRGIRAMSAGGHGCTRSSSRRSRPGRAAASRSC